MIEFFFFLLLLLLLLFDSFSHRQRRSSRHVNARNHTHTQRIFIYFTQMLNLCSECIFQDDRSKIRKLLPEQETLYLKYIIELNKEIIRRGDNINLIFEDDQGKTIEFIKNENFNFQFHIKRYEMPEQISELIFKKYCINNDGLLNCQLFIDDFVLLT